ncbi:hypothetical protein ACXX9E_28590 [Pseudomonas sp. GNP014]
MSRPAVPVHQLLPSVAAAMPAMMAASTRLVRQQLNSPLEAWTMSE